MAEKARVSRIFRVISCPRLPAGSLLQLNRMRLPPAGSASMRRGRADFRAAFPRAGVQDLVQNPLIHGRPPGPGRTGTRLSAGAWRFGKQQSGSLAPANGEEHRGQSGEERGGRRR